MSTDHHPALGGPAGFLRALFDLSFRRLITPRLIKVLYVLWLAITVVVLIAITVSIFDGQERARTVSFGPGGFVSDSEVDEGGSVLGGLAFLFLGAPLLFLLSAIAGRVQLEFLIALFQVAENTGAMRQALGAPAGAPTGGTGGPPAGGSAPGGGPRGPAPAGPAMGGGGPASPGHDAGPDDGPLFGGRGPQGPPPGTGPVGPGGPPRGA
ncbi:DUF4282 domain-containing protein [Patulibacter americanus]|uniref:DUF4282 domain-containing protein n=1 Tax=Patulibacter americanus TaxID=588672 RepID=UPI0004061065|nr:DUF4282 domain-containing protein [Patulibacter americanus]